MKEKVKICGEEFEFDSGDEIENLYLAFVEIQRLKNLPYPFGEVGIIIKNGKIERVKPNYVLKASDRKKISKSS